MVRRLQELMWMVMHLQETVVLASVARVAMARLRFWLAMSAASLAPRRTYFARVASSIGNPW